MSGHAGVLWWPWYDDATIPSLLEMVLIKARSTSDQNCRCPNEVEGGRVRMCVLLGEGGTRALWRKV